MAIKAANPMAPFDYRPLASEDGDTAVFRLRGLTPLELFDVNAGAEQVVDERGQVQAKWTARAARVAFRAGLLGWDGFMDADGKPVEFKPGVDANIERLGFNLTTELFAAIMNASNLSEDQRKN